MAKYLKIGTDGNPIEEAGVSTSAGAGDSGRLPQLNASGILDDTITNASATSAADKLVKAGADGKIALGYMPTGVGAETKDVVTSEDLAAGDMVNLYNNAGTLTARKADADAVGTRCDGFVLAATTTGANATVYLSPGIITGLSGLTPGSDYFLSATAGGIATTVPSTAGQIVQKVGKALSATELAWNAAEPIVRA